MDTIIDTRNFLNKSDYLFFSNNARLHHAFLTGSLDWLEGDYNINIIVVRIFNRGSKVLVYNYASYHSAFFVPLVYYLANRNVLMSHVFKEPGSFLSLIGLFGARANMPYLYLNNDQLNYIRRGFRTLATYETANQQMLDYAFKFINTLGYFTNHNHMAELIEIAFSDEYALFLKEIVNNGDIRKVLDKFSKSDIEHNTSILDGCVFIIKENDMVNFLSSIREKGFNINTGSRKYSGSISGMSNYLNTIDQDFRKSLYLHNCYHVKHGNLSNRDILTRKHFSFKNIHMNIGGIRWYSTNRNYSSSNHGYLESYKPTKLLLDKFRNEDQSDVFNQLAEYFRNLPHNEETQLKIENFLLEYSKSLFDIKKHKKKDSPVDYSLFSTKFVNLLNNKTEELNSLIDNTRNRVYKTKPKSNRESNLYYLNNILKIVNNEYVISIVYGRLLLISNINNKLNNYESSFYISLGRDLVNYYHYCLYVKYKSTIDVKNTFTMSDWKDINKDIVSIYNNDSDGFVGMIGGILVKWMLDLDLIVRDWLKLPLVKTVGILVPSKEVSSVLKNENNTTYLPRRMPMIVKPKPYYREKRKDEIIDRLGGYLLNDVKYTNPLIKPKWDMLKSSIVKEKNLLYSMANNVNSVAFKINKDVLDFVKDYGDLYNLLDLEDFEYLIDKSKLNKTEHIQLESFLSKRALYENILGLATAYSNVNEFYLPIRIEFRGRLNCISDFLNYQSSELAKSLLLFSRPEKLYKTDEKSIAYFKAYGANCYGNKIEKKSWNERIKWLNNNEDDIINFRNGKLISEADDKLLFIAFCFEYNRFYKIYNNIESTYFETYLPIKLDATCNGYQHIALLSGDNNLSRELNLTRSTWDDSPKDFYGYIGLNLVSWAKNKLESTPKSNPNWESYDRLSRVEILRAILKGPVMTWAYNISPLGLVKKIKSLFIPVKDLDTYHNDFHFEVNDKLSAKQNKSKNKVINKEIYFNEYFKYTKDDSITLKGKDFNIIRLGLEDILNNNIFKIKKLVRYLDTIANILTKLSLPIMWGAPNGVNVIQSYLLTKETKLKPFSSSKRAISLTIPDTNKGFNKRKQLRSFMPNLIHSLDASSLALLIDLYFSNNSNEVKNIFTIHDCFAVTANNVGTVMNLLKLVYIKIYSDSEYLRELDKSIRNVILLNCDKGTFNEQKLEIYVNGETIKYPSVDGVLGNDSTSVELLKDSSYIMH